MVFMSEDTQYKDLIEHLRNWILRLPESEYLMPMLKLRFKPEDAQLLSNIPFLGHTAEQLSVKVNIPVKKLAKKLDKYAKSGLIFRSERGSEVRYSLCDSLFMFYRSIGWKGKNDKLNREISPYLNKFYFFLFISEPD